MSEYCVCGHPDWDHRDKMFPGLISKGKMLPGSQCLKVLKGRDSFFCPCKNFKLDNLKLIEGLAIQKGLA